MTTRFNDALTRDMAAYVGIGTDPLHADDLPRVWAAIGQLARVDDYLRQAELAIHARKLNAEAAYIADCHIEDADRALAQVDVATVHSHLESLESWLRFRCDEFGLSVPAVATRKVVAGAV